MSDPRLFQLGMDLETGATQTEDLRDDRATISGIDPVDDERKDHFIRRDGKTFAGTHLIIEVVDGQGLDSVERMERAFRRCIERCKATLLHIHLHKFSPQGVSGVAVLAESHISVHTWPEIGYGAFDVFMCGDAEPWRAVDILREEFDAGDVRVRELLRGEEIVAERTEALAMAAE